MKIAINGYGRIGRSFLRAFYEAPKSKVEDINIIAINELGDIETMAHLTKYDSTHGVFHKHIDCRDHHLIVDDHKIVVFNEKKIESLPWDAFSVDYFLKLQNHQPVIDAYHNTDLCKTHSTM